MFVSIELKKSAEILWMGIPALRHKVHILL
jgi:hypothetical protein